MNRSKEFLLEESRGEKLESKSSEGTYMERRRLRLI